VVHDLRGRLQAVELAAQNGNADLEELNQLLEQASEELDFLANLANPEQ
jgi:hypothetical protein